ncbi:MAG TPA: hypothetical protein VK772_16785 [Puia sp.]|jgi:hypothetical protein|nr:hypothetical protein [Puia sp.]
MVNAKKKRADKYDTKLAINGSFEDVIKVMVAPTKQEPEKEKSPTLFADFHNNDNEGRIRFTNGTLSDIKRLNLEIKEGLEIILDDGEEFIANGVIEFSKEENIWVMKYDKMMHR